jgi:serine protease inhibitor
MYKKHLSDNNDNQQYWWFSMRFNLSVVSVLFILVMASSLAEEDTVDDSQMDLTNMGETASANNRFALDIYRELAGEGENVFFSPWSLSSALAMTYEGQDR